MLPPTEESFERRFVWTAVLGKTLTLDYLIKRHFIVMDW